MSFFKNLRAKILLASLIPGTLALMAVALIALVAYEGVARDVVRQRDTELAKISAARLSSGLTRHSGILQTAAHDDDILSLEPARIGRALERFQIELFAFDAGVVIYNDQGVAVGSDPFSFKRRGGDFPARTEFDKVRTSRRPSFSNVFEDAISGKEVILVTVPIVDTGNDFKGVIAGMSTLESLVSDQTYSTVLEITAGRKGFAYLVDGQGKVIYHQDTSLLGKSLAVIDPVTRATRRETGAVIADDPTGESVISGFAPVPDTDFSIEWAVITQDRWKEVVGPIRRASRLTLGILVLGGVLASALVFFAIGRVLKPVKELTQGAQRIAEGDFDYSIVANSGDEIQELAQQFTIMADALKESYAGLEQKVEARTEELAASELRYRDLFEESRDAIFITSPEGRFIDVNRAALDLFGCTREEIIESDVAPNWFDPQDRGKYLKELDEAGSVSNFAMTVLRKDGIVLDCEVSAILRRSESGTETRIQGIVRDVTEIKRSEAAALEQAREVAVLEERNRMAHEIHDTMAQGFTGIVLQMEAAEQSMETSPGALPEHLNRARALAREGLQEARRSVWGLMPHALEQSTLEAALQEEVRRFDAEGRSKVTFAQSGKPRELPPDVQTVLLRICQESLTNIRRHADASQVDVTLNYDEHEVLLSVQDNGSGFDPPTVEKEKRGLSFGLTGMRQRAEQINGQLIVDSTKNQGTLVRLTIPTP